jgi:hypothetical protein
MKIENLLVSESIAPKTFKIQTTELCSITCNHHVPCHILRNLIQVERMISIEGVGRKTMKRIIQ